MASSLRRAFLERYIIIIRPSKPHIYSRTDAFTLSGFTSACKAALNDRNSTGHRVAYIIINRFNAPTETEEGEMIPARLEPELPSLLCVCAAVSAIARAQRRAHRTRSLHSLTKH